MTTITIFNASTLPVQMQVNNGPQFGIAAASTTTWAPSSPAAASNPTWSNTTPSANVFAPGPNYCSITPSGVIQPYTFIVDIPRKQVYTTIQIYTFFNTYSDVSWILLSDGQFVTGSIKMNAAGMMEALSADAGGEAGAGDDDD